MKCFFYWFIDQKNRELLLAGLPGILILLMYLKYVISNDLQTQIIGVLPLILLTLICILCQYCLKHIQQHKIFYTFCFFAKQFLIIVLVTLGFVLLKEVIKIDIYISSLSSICFIMLISWWFSIVSNLIQLNSKASETNFSIVIGKIKNKFNDVKFGFITVMILFFINILIWLVVFGKINPPLIYDLLLVIIDSFVFFFLLPSKGLVNNKVDITFLNLDFDDILAHKLYFNDYKIKNLIKPHIYKIDFSNYVPKDKELEISVLNHQHIKANMELYNSPYFYYCIDAATECKICRLKVMIEYQDKRKIRKFFDLIIETSFMENELVINKVHIYEYYKKYCRIFFKGYASKESVNLSRIVKGLYQYNQDFRFEKDQIFANQIINDSRKWVLHDGGFGNGKSTLDCLYVSNLGYRPVIISPWEDNYDTDFLYLIFHQLVTETGKYFCMPNMNVVLIYLLSLAGLVPFLKICFETIYLTMKKMIILQPLYDVIYSFFNYLLSNHLQQLFDSKIDLFLITSLIVSYFILSVILPNIIIHSKESTKFHQDFYCKHIKKILDREKVILIVEDIDRLEENAIKNFFRVLSNINKECVNVHRIIGILAFNSKDEKINNDWFETIKSKIIYDEVFKDYDYEKTKRLYTTVCLSNMMKVWRMQFNIDVNTLNEKMAELVIKIRENIDAYDFREIHSELDKLCDLVTSLYENYQ